MEALERRSIIIVRKSILCGCHIHLLSLVLHTLSLYITYRRYRHSHNHRTSSRERPRQRYYIPQRAYVLGHSILSDQPSVYQQFITMSSSTSISPTSSSSQSGLFPTSATSSYSVLFPTSTASTSRDGDGDKNSTNVYYLVVSPQRLSGCSGVHWLMEAPCNELYCLVSRRSSCSNAHSTVLGRPSYAHAPPLPSGNSYGSCQR